MVNHRFVDASSLGNMPSRSFGPTIYLPACAARLPVHEIFHSRSRASAFWLAPQPFDQRCGVAQSERVSPRWSDHPGAAPESKAVRHPHDGGNDTTFPDV